MRPALKWARNIALVLLGLVTLVVGTVIWLWQQRHSLDDLDWPIAASVFEPTDLVTVTWLGTSTLLFDDQETQVLIDGNFTRLKPWEIGLFLPVSSDIATINYALAEFKMDRLAAIVPVHSHFDHAMDVGHVANRTSAVILGSESTTNIARGAAVPIDQFQALAEGETRQFGEFTIRLIASRHAPIKPGSDGPFFPGNIEGPLRQPASVNAWKEGVVWTVILSHPRGTTLIQGSAGYIEDKLNGESADVVMLGVGGLAGLSKDYVAQYWDETVAVTGASRVLVIHHDDYTAPFGEVLLLPDFFDNVALTASWIDQIIDEREVPVEIELPPFGQPVPLY